jgi:hypothetical protein
LASQARTAHLKVRLPLSTSRLGISRLCDSAEALQDRSEFADGLGMVSNPFRRTRGSTRRLISSMISARVAYR